MTILIPTEISDDENFVKFLMQLVPDIFNLKFNVGKSLAFDDKVNKLGLYKAKFNSQEILNIGVKNLSCVKLKEGYQIQVNPYRRIGKYGDTIDSLCKFITYGNTEVKGYDVLLQVAEDLFNDIDIYMKYYYGIY